MKLGLPIRASKPITPVCGIPSLPCRRTVRAKLSHYSALYDIQNELTRKSFVPSEPAQLGHVVHGAATAFGPLYFATFCALSVTLGALLFNLTNVLNEYFAIQQQLAKKPEERPLLFGVDVCSSRMFKQQRVLAAVEFAAAAHAGQKRKTGEPYVSHCIETALIVEANLPHWRHDHRHEAAVIAALLHDTLDDTPTTVEQITAAFGPAVAAMVVKVSKLSQINQMLRRDKRKGVVSSEPSYWQSQWSRLKRMMFEAVVEEPLVILVKLADRLHNMRTVYALSPDKQQAVAEETLAVWCSMAASLGWHRLKSEMEDLCFAVVDQSTYCTLRQQLDKLWSSPPRPRSRRKVRNSARQQQLQHFAARQQAMAEARVGVWQGMGQSLRDLRGLLGYGTRRLPGGTPAAAAAAASAAAAAVEALPDAAASADFSMDTTAAGVPGLVASHLDDCSSNLSAEQQQQQQQLQQKKRLEGLNVLSRLWPTAATPLLPAPAEEGERDFVEPQRASGGDWGVTDAAVSLKALLGSSIWAANRRQQQQQQDVAAPAAATQQQQQQQQEPAVAVKVSPSRSSKNSTKASQQQQKNTPQLTPQQEQLQNVLSTVVPFDAVSLTGSKGLTWSAQQGLRVLEEAAERLYNELAVGSFSSGLEVEIQGRLKSLRSVHNKMQRKKCSVEEVYDARALRVVVDDAGGKRLADAVQCCYRLISAVHKLWHPIHGEFDDYIANPKPSGYQALHTAVWGPGGAALEVQIKTSGMHEHAEYGGAAHWAYKEVLWGSAPAAAAAVNAIEVGSSSNSEGGQLHGAAAAVAVAAAKGPVQSLPAVTFTFDDEGMLLNSSAAAATAAATSSSSSNVRTGSLFDFDLEDVSSIPAVAAASSSRSSQELTKRLAESASSSGGSSSSSRRTLTAVTAATAVAAPSAVEQRAESSLLARVAALSRQQQAQEPALAATASRTSTAVQTLQRPTGPGGSSSSSTVRSGTAGPKPGQLPRLASLPSKQQQGQQKQQQQEEQQQQSQIKLAPSVYAGQPILRISDRLRYGVVLAVNNSSSSSSSPSANPMSRPWSSSSSSSGRSSVLCVIMSGGTNPDHPWRMPDYGFYHQLLQYAAAAGWLRPGQGDWHARLEEYEWCRDGRWHRRDHMGYLHPHTTLTLLEGYEHDAAEATAVAQLSSRPSSSSSWSSDQDSMPVSSHSRPGASTSSSTTSSSSSQSSTVNKGKDRKNAALLLHSWATGGSWLPAQTAAALNDDSSSRTSSSSSSSRKSPSSKSKTGSSKSTKQEKQSEAASDQPTAATAAASGSDWAATAAKAAQLRSVIEWGLEAYGMEEQQGSEVSVLIWPGGTIEDVPRGTTAGEILREKGVFAILDAPTDSDTETPDTQPSSNSSSSMIMAVVDRRQQRQWRSGSSIAEMLESQERQQCRLVNVNNRLVAEDTVLSDGDLVILARERIKI